MSRASWPSFRSAATSVLSRMQLPQNIPAAPDVMNAILMKFRKSGVGEVRCRDTGGLLDTFRRRKSLPKVAKFKL